MKKKNLYKESSPEHKSILEEIRKAENTRDINKLLFDRELTNLTGSMENSRKLAHQYSKYEDEKIKELINDSIKKSSLFDYLDELFSNFDSLNGVSKLAFTMVFSSSIILWSLFGLFLNLYGNYLLERFKLEDRYPKIAIFIKYRKTLSKYYIISNFFAITSLCLINIILGLSILSL